jgi:hypothetical protein
MRQPGGTGRWGSRRTTTYTKYKAGSFPKLPAFLFPAFLGMILTRIFRIAPSE